MRVTERSTGGLLLAGLTIALAVAPTAARCQGPVAEGDPASRLGSLDAGRGQALLKQSREALQNKNMPAAITAFRRAAALFPKAPQLKPELDAQHGRLVAAGVAPKELTPASPLVPGAPGALQLPGAAAPDTAGGVAPPRRLPPADAGGASASGGVRQAGGPIAMEAGVRQGDFQSDRDATQTVPAAAVDNDSPGAALFRQGMEALEAGNRDEARRLFSEAWKHEEELDPVVRRQLKEKLTLVRPDSASPASGGRASGPLDEVDMQQRQLRQKVYREITSELAAANEIRTSDALGALDRMKQLRRRVGETSLDRSTKQQMLAMVDRAIDAQEGYVAQNRADIDQEIRNEQVMDDIENEQAQRRRVDEEISELVEQFNQLMDERRYEEAEVLAKQVYELRPGSEIATMMFHKSRISVRQQEMEDILAAKEDGYQGVMRDVERAAVAIDDDTQPLRFGDARSWEDLSRVRLQREDDGSPLMGPREKEIQGKLGTQVDVKFDERPLWQVVDTLSALTGIPMYLDERALSELRLTRETPVTINLNQRVSLRSALQLILTQLDLTYVIRNEVLEITSREAVRSNVFQRVYKVSDLVTPIPNFVSSYDVGLPGALRAAHSMVGTNLSVQAQPVSLTGLATNTSQVSPESFNPNMLGQFGPAGMGGGMGGGMAGGRSGGMGGFPSPGSAAGGGGGGAAMADFDSLMELIQSTVVPETWEELGGPSTMSPYPGNLSLVVSTTSEVHDQIRDLLESLRRLQNLQVTIEVRFISLSDNFFERIGIDFDFDIDDNVSRLPDDDDGSSVTVGIGSDGTPTADFDLSFTQSSLASTIPTFGGFDTGTAATFGFAILSDIEAFLFLEAAQGDSRTNVLQAPKVTLFDGQMASINDTTQRPFVMSVVPVVGDFAVAQQPVIVVLNEGTQLNVQAVVSDDRRFVRLTLVPFFSRIGEVDTFTFEGRRRRSTSSSRERDTNGDGEIDEDDEEEEEEIVEGTTVQLPTFAFTSVSTTVSVPDGGTILLGGIKRLREQRNERGVPMLNKVPYVNRLFRNVGIGRETNSLMLMVTPRIIIEEEEEMAQTGFDPTR